MWSRMLKGHLLWACIYNTTTERGIVPEKILCCLSVTFTRRRTMLSMNTECVWRFLLLRFTADLSSESWSKHNVDKFLTCSSKRDVKPCSLVWREQSVSRVDSSHRSGRHSPGANCCWCCSSQEHLSFPSSFSGASPELWPGQWMRKDTACSHITQSFVQPPVLSRTCDGKWQCHCLFCSSGSSGLKAASH